jgi:hypothetical protein
MRVFRAGNFEKKGGRDDNKTGGRDEKRLGAEVLMQVDRFNGASPQHTCVNIASPL